jgi:hypothetical protein
MIKTLERREVKVTAGPILSNAGERVKQQDRE